MRPERASPRHAPGPRPRACRHKATANPAAMIAASSGPPSPRNAPPTAAATRSASPPSVSSRQNRVAKYTKLELACHIAFPVDSIVELTLQPQFVVGGAFVLVGACSGLAGSSPGGPVCDVVVRF